MSGSSDPVFGPLVLEGLSKPLVSCLMTHRGPLLLEQKKQSKLHLSPFPESEISTDITSAFQPGHFESARTDLIFPFDGIIPEHSISGGLDKMHWVVVN